MIKKSKSKSKPKTKTKAKRKNAPLMAVKPRKGNTKKPRPRGHSAVFVVRLAPILERTRAGRAELDLARAGVDLSAYDHLPDVVKGAPRHVVKQRWRADTVSRKQPRSSPVDRSLPAVFLSRKQKSCKNCRRPDHHGMGCQDLQDWLSLAADVLAGKLDDFKTASAGTSDETLPTP